MTTITEKRVCRDRFLLIFGQKACTRRRLAAYQEGECCLYFSADELMLLETVSLRVMQREGMYYIQEERLYEDQPFYYHTFRKEKLMLILTKELAGMERAGRLLIQRNEICQIGNAYRNRVFYNCCSLAGAESASISVVDGRYRIRSQTESEGIYLNEMRLDRERELSDGDRIDIYGLHLLLCG
ncbi:MAG: FHA domain-containing protein, partial [Lachnospiraceae bacterium]|nr:FHA domain-containing protein [Lachnospiraceae bacterium]